jgi:hypothetical protein
METQKEYLKIILLQRTYIRIEGYFTASIGNVSKEEADIAYEPGLKLALTSIELKTQGFYTLSYKK